MKLNLRSLALISYSALATLAGCASSSTYEAPVGGAASAHPEPAPDLSGTWALALGMSDVAETAQSDAPRAARRYHRGPRKPV